MNNIYLDYTAATPVDERVTTAMQPYFTQIFGNPSSLHRFGQQAESALEKSRRALTGHPEERLVNHANFVFEGIDGNLLISILDAAGFTCSSGSDCKTGDPEPSSVLTHLGYSPSWALGSLRATLGKNTTAEEIDSFLKFLPGCIHQIRELKS